MHMDTMGREHEVFADAVAAEPVEMYAIEKEKPKLQSLGADGVDMVKMAYLDSPRTLPAFAELYNISADIKDYVMIPVVIMPSDLPNRNKVGFPMAELAKANPDTGTLAYQTWVNKPTFVEHDNRDYTKAKGIILSSAMRLIKGVEGDLWKVIVLATFDRTRDPVLANDILTKKRNAYSMGAWCKHYTCSICGTQHPKNTCEHITFGKRGPFEMVGDQLAFLQARDILGFETSSVKTPAYLSAETDHVIKMF